MSGRAARPAGDMVFCKVTESAAPVALVGGGAAFLGRAFPLDVPMPVAPKALYTLAAFALAIPLADAQVV